MPLIEILFISALSFFTSMLSGATGMGGGAIFLAGLTVPLSAAIPIHAVVQLSSNVQRVFYLRNYLKKEIILPFLMGGVFGILVVSFLVRKLDNEFLPYSLILAILLYSLFKPKSMPAIKLNKYGFLALGFASCFLGVIMGVVGPLTSPFFLREDFCREEIVSNQAFCQMFTHFVKIPIFIGLGFSYLEYLFPLICFLLAGFLGTYLGVKLLSYISRNTFFIIFKIFLFFVTIKIAYSLYLLGVNT